jgi:hypothetical protein
MSAQLPKCLVCARVEWHIKHYSCPRNKRFNPKTLPPHFAENCALYIAGKPILNRKRISFSNFFDVEIGGSYRTVHVTAKKGYELKIDPESTCQKITIIALEEEKEAK